jgi:hypothetical protein
MTYVCDGSSADCPSTCSVNGDCSAGNFCDVNVCAPLAANGTPCSNASDCASNFCVDGVCCNEICDQAVCYMCLGADYAIGGGGHGTCAPVASGDDPENDCKGGTPVCDGAGACM